MVPVTCWYSMVLATMYSNIADIAIANSILLIFATAHHTRPIFQDSYQLTLYPTWDFPRSRTEVKYSHTCLEALRMILSLEGVDLGRSSSYNRPNSTKILFCPLKSKKIFWEHSYRIYYPSTLFGHSNRRHRWEISVMHQTETTSGPWSMRP